MRQIKFRGIPTAGEVPSIYRLRYVYGYYYEHDGKSYIISGDESWQVKPNSLAQLIGADKNDKEVYEGDILLDELEQEHLAEIYDRPQFLKTLTLKKEQ